MNSFANPDEAKTYEYPEFPRPERKVMKVDYSQVQGAEKFKELDVDRPESKIAELPIVATVLFQDFKEVLSKNPS